MCVAFFADSESLVRPAGSHRDGGGRKEAAAMFSRSLLAAGRTAGAAFVALLIPFSAALPARAAHDRVRYALVGEPTSLNPLFLSGYWFSLVGELAFEPLLRLGANGAFVPALATVEPSLKNGGISADGRTITFHLRRGTVWSDGSPVTSADVKFAVDQELNPKNIIGSRSGFDQITSMRTPDAQTILFGLRRPDASAFVALAQTTPLPKHLLGAFADLNRVAYNALPVGNGPFRVVAWNRGDNVRFEANERYWRGRPKVPVIDVRIIPDQTTALLQFQTHEIDLLRVLPSQMTQLPASGINRNIAPSLAWTQIGFNLANPAFADARVRRAVMLAIDRQKLATVIGHGLYKTDRLMLPMFQWALDEAVTPPAFDLVAANRLLDASGWTLGPDGARHKDGRTLDVTMVYRSGGDSVLPATVAADLEQVHVHVDQKGFQAGLLFDTAAAGGILATGKFDIALLGLQTNPDPDVSWLFACDQRAPAGFNYWHYCDGHLDAHLRQGASTFDRARRGRAVAAVQRDLLADAAFDPLYRIDDLWVSAAWLHGLDPSAYGPFWNVYDWSISDP